MGQSDLVERVGRAMIRAAISELLKVMIEESDWPGQRNAIVVEDFAENHGIDISR